MLHAVKLHPNYSKLNRAFKVPYFSMYKTILLSKIFRLKIEGRLIHGNKLRREKNQVEGKAGIKVILQAFDPCFPLHLVSLSKKKAGITVVGNWLLHN